MEKLQLTIDVQNLVSLGIQNFVLWETASLGLSHLSDKFTIGQFGVDHERTVARVGTARGPHTASEFSSKPHDFLSEVIGDVDDETPLGTTALALETRRFFCRKKELEKR